MPSPHCDEVRLWITSSEGVDAQSVPPALCEHVAGCEQCRAALLLLSAELLGAPLVSESITCTACQDDLPAYIDIERLQGMAAAVRAYPHVWWHLWVCTDCAETYALTITLLDAVAEGSLEALPQLQKEETHRHTPHFRISLPRAWFAYVLTPQAGPAWGDEGETVLHESEEEGYQFNLSMRPAPDGSWYAIITVVPPISGKAVVTLGELSLRAPLDENGQAMVGPIPTTLLATPSGPDMRISIEPLEE